MIAIAICLCTVFVLIPSVDEADDVSPGMGMWGQRECEVISLQGLNLKRFGYIVVVAVSVAGKTGNANGHVFGNRNIYRAFRTIGHNDKYRGISVQRVFGLEVSTLAQIDVHSSLINSACRLVLVLEKIHLS